VPQVDGGTRPRTSAGRWPTGWRRSGSRRRGRRGTGRDQLGDREPQRVLHRAGDREHRIVRHLRRWAQRPPEPREVGPTAPARRERASGGGRPVAERHAVEDRARGAPAPPGCGGTSSPARGRPQAAQLPVSTSRRSPLAACTAPATWSTVRTKPVSWSSSAAPNTTPITRPSGAIIGPPELPERTTARTV